MRFRLLAIALASLLVPPASAVAADVATTPHPTSAAAIGAPPDAEPPVPSSTVSPYLPDREDVTDCLSSLPPPDCGSEERGGAGQWLAFGALMSGMAFIGWRIARSVRRRDRALSPDA